MRNQNAVFADKLQPVVSHFVKSRKIFQKVIRQAVNLICLLGNFFLRVNVLMIRLAGRNMVYQFYRAYFNQTFAFFGIKTRRFRIKNNFPYHINIPVRL